MDDLDSTHLVTFIIFHTQTTDTDSRIRPNVYSLLISPLDSLNQNLTLIATNSSTESDGIVILRATSCLQTKRRWDMVVLAYNCTEHILSDTNELSKIIMLILVYMHTEKEPDTCHT